MAISWNNSLIIDNGIIDEDHKFLIMKIGELQQSIQFCENKDSLLHKLNVIRTFAEQHFKREEELQRAAGFPGHEGHKVVHEVLLDELIVNTKRILFDCGPNNSEEDRNRRKLAIEKFMNKWLIKHITQEDTQMKPYVAAMRDRASRMSPLTGFIRKLAS